MAQPPEDESFLARWSKRKRAEAATPEPEPEAKPDVLPVEDDSISEEDLAALPSLDDFTPQTDIRPFLRKGVPSGLRNAALRKIWLLTPAIRDHKDPAVDYAWDWNTPGGVPGDGAAPTAERAAQMLRDLVRPRRDAEPQSELESNEKQDEEPPRSDPDSATQQSRSHPAKATPDPDPIAAHDVAKSEEKQSTNETPPPRRRHGGALPS